MLELEFYMKLLESPIIEKRIKAVTQIREILESLTDHAQVIRQQRVNFSDTFLGNWLISQNFIGLVLENSHEELIKRSSFFFIFLGHKEMLTCEIIDKIWRIVQDQHNTLQAAAYEVIIHITPLLSFELKQDLYHKILEKCKGQLLNHYVKFIADFSIRAMDREKKVFYALDMLYQLSHDAFDHLMHELVINCFCDVLKNSRSPDKIKHYLQLTICNIKSRESVSQSLMILVKILTEVIRSFHNLVEIEEVYAILDEHGEGFKTFISKFCKGILEGSEKSIFSSTKNIKTVIKLWKFMILSDSFHIEVSEIQQILVSFSQNKNKKGTKKFLKRLLKLIKYRFSLDKSQEILETLFLSSYISPISISTEAFDVFLELFIKINSEKKLIDLQHLKFFSRISEILIGESYIYEVYFQSSDSSLVERSKKLIIDLQLKLSGPLTSKKEEVWQEFKTVLHKTLSSEDSTEHYSKALHLLLMFLSNPEIRKDDQNRNSVVYYAMIQEIGGYKTLPINDKLTTLGMIRRKIAVIYSKPLCYVVLAIHGERYDYLTDEILISSIREPWNITVEFNSRVNPLTPVEFFQKHEDFLIELLNKIHLLSLENANLVWLVLKKCSVIQCVHRQIEEFLISFDNFFPKTSLYTLIYHLSIIKNLINDHSWLETFQDNSGIETLAKVYVELDWDNKYSDQLILEYNMSVINILAEIAKFSDTLPTEIIAKIIKSLIQVSQTCQEGEEIAEFCRNTKDLISIVKKRNLENYLKTFVACPIRELLASAFIKCTCHVFCASISSLFLEHSHNMPCLNELFLTELLELFDLAITSCKSESYWILLSFYIEQGNPTIGLLSRFSIFVDKLKAFPAENSKEQPNPILSGLLKVLKTVAKKNDISSPELTNLVLHHCLFETPSTANLNSPKCKNKQTRTEAFGLLYEMFKKSPEVQSTVFSYLSFQYKDPQWRTSKSSDWNYKPLELEKSFTGYVGLKNLGCICYINSVIQQLYSIDLFREFFLSLTPTEETKSTLLHQVQQLLSALKHSEKQFISPKSLCKVLKDSDGQPLNVREQMDADEFINSFMNELDTLLVKQYSSSVIKDMFTGYLTTEITGSAECSHKSEVLEGFITLPLHVKNKKHIKNSLESFIEGESLEGNNAYHCSLCEGKVSAVRRVCIKYLPNVLFMTLRRFEFNYDTMRRVKLNEFCEFPSEINMENFTQEGLERKDKNIEDGLEKQPDDYYQYQLRGVIIHSGTEESGHYYSLIKIKDQWLEFNDTVVMPFDSSDIPQECFGDDGKVSLKSSYSVAKLRNAYILIYARQQLFQYNPKESVISPLELKISSPEQEFAEVILENERFWRSKFSFSSEYFDFILELLISKEIKTLRFCICIFFTVMIRSEDYCRIAPCVMTLKDRFKDSIELSDWVLLMVSNKPVLKELFFDCPVAEKRKIMSGLVHAALDSASTDGQSIFIYTILNYLPLAKEPHCYNYANYFELIYFAIKLQPEFILIFQIHLRLFEYLKGMEIQTNNDKYEENNLELEQLGYENYQDGEEKLELSKSYDGGSLIYLVLCLRLCSIYYDFHQINEIISESTVTLILENCKNKSAGRNAGVFYAIICSEDSEICIRFVKVLIGILEKNHCDKYKFYMRPLFWILYNQGKMASDSTDPIMQLLFNLMSSADFDLADLDYCLKFTLKLAVRLMNVKKWLKKHSKEMNLMENSLNDKFYQNTSMRNSAKCCLNSLDYVKKYIKDSITIKNFQDSDDDMIQENALPGSELLYFNPKTNEWVKCSITVNIDEIICIKNDKEGINKWLIPTDDSIKRL